MDAILSPYMGQSNTSARYGKIDWQNNGFAPMSGTQEEHNQFIMRQLSCLLEQARDRHCLADKTFSRYPSRLNRLANPENVVVGGC